MDQKRNSDNENKSRRNFLNILLESSAVVFLISVFYPIIKFLSPPHKGEAIPKSVVAANINELKPNNGKIFRFGSKPGILIKTTEGELRAFTAVCTHLECTVQYRSDFQHIWCACHNGHYDLTGRNISGPPPRPLKPYSVNVKEGKVFVSLLSE